MAHAHRPGDRLETFDACGRWVPCVILKLAGYAGKSGPGYYAAYEPNDERCRSFWTCDKMLRPRGTSATGTKCWELACHFLADVPHASDDDRVQLAHDLQQTAEDAIQDLAPYDCCQACGACPGFIGAECDETCDWAKASEQAPS